MVYNRGTRDVGPGISTGSVDGLKYIVTALKDSQSNGDMGNTAT